MEAIIYSILFAMSFAVFRYVYIKLNKKLAIYFADGPYGDAATYFFLIQFFRKSNCGIPDKRCLISNEPVLVPSLYMKMIGKLFSDKKLFKQSWLPNIFLFTIAAAAFIYFLFSFGLGYFEILLFTLPLFLLQPDNISLDKHRIHYSVLQPRYLGLLVNSAFWLAYIYFGVTPVVFAVLTVLTTASLNISYFCRQSSAFVTVLVALVMLDPYLFLTLPAAVFISMILFPKEFMPSVIPQIKFSYQYFLNYYKPKPSGNPLIHFVKNFFARALFESFPYFGSVLVLAFAVYFFIDSSSSFVLGEDILKRILSVYSSLFFVFILTGIRRFAFLGECWRYFSFCSYFTTPLFLGLFVLSLQIPVLYEYLIIGGIILTYICLAILGTKALFENKNRYLTELLNENQDEFKDAVWYGIPYRASTLVVALGYGKKTFEYQYGHHTKEIHDEYFAQYPFLKWSKELLKSNKVTHILVENELEKKAVDISGVSFERLAKIATNDYYTIYRYH